ncbi:MAG: hypothetical protein IJQ73_05275 [Kiritimatiellae bacterium]|nr:hypothetical protein [Kiritimatiellia bacterium]
MRELASSSRRGTDVPQLRLALQQKTSLAVIMGKSPNALPTRYIAAN